MSAWWECLVDEPAAIQPVSASRANISRTAGA
jgi:hypothetical protein